MYAPLDLRLVIVPLRLQRFSHEVQTRQTARDCRPFILYRKTDKPPVNTRAHTKSVRINVDPRLIRTKARLGFSLLQVPSLQA